MVLLLLIWCYHLRKYIKTYNLLILSTTLTIVIITVVINGGMVVKVLQWLNIPTGVTEEASGAEEQLVTSPSGQSSYNTLEKGEESLQENFLASSFFYVSL